MEAWAARGPASTRKVRARRQARALPIMRTVITIIRTLIIIIRTLIIIIHTL
jgi:hypothetical protein